MKHIYNLILISSIGVFLSSCEKTKPETSQPSEQRELSTIGEGAVTSYEKFFDEILNLKNSESLDEFRRKTTDQFANLRDLSSELKKLPRPTKEQIKKLQSQLNFDERMTQIGGQIFKIRDIIDNLSPDQKKEFDDFMDKANVQMNGVRETLETYLGNMEPQKAPAK